MPGIPDSIYVRARKVLLDALQALQEQLDAVVLVGAQAIYIHTGESELAVPPFTTDADLVLDPASLLDEPKLVDAMGRGGFVPDKRSPGIWTTGIGGGQVDLLVPEKLGGGGRRGARLGAHGNRGARKVRGLEAALVDPSPIAIEALDPADDRRFVIMVGSPAALLVAKLHKLWERQGKPGRQDDKDAFDAYRLLVFMETPDAAHSIRGLLADERSANVTKEALSYLRELFGAANSPGSQMAGRSVEGLDDPIFITASCAALTRDIVAALEERD
jgi:hypothetical protein